MTEENKTEKEFENEEVIAEETSAEEITPEVVEEVQEEVVEEEPLRAQFMRLSADFDNYRKRVARERTELYVRANQDLIEELLPVVDHYEMGLANAEKLSADESILSGFKMVYDQLMKVLATYKVTPIDSEGKEFDPHTQEAVSQLPSADVAENVVMYQVRRGYMMGDKLLRAAQVVVSSGSPTA